MHNVRRSDFRLTVRPLPSRTLVKAVPGVQANLLLVSAFALSALWPGSPVIHQATVSTPSNAAATVHEPWRPLHKGHVNISTGHYIREDDDLVVNTPFPIVLRRTYNSGDSRSRQFGLDATHSGEWWIYGNSDPSVPWGELILPDAVRIHFTRISPGDTRVGAVLRYDGTSTEFNGALLRWEDPIWRMRLSDGSTASFLDCRGKVQPCALIERGDPDGHRIDYVRDASGLLQRMSSEGQSIAFDYDDRKRIVRASDTSKREVTYTYDEGGRLVRAVTSDGTVRDYRYDARNNLTRIQEPGRIVENWFDGDNRWARQVVKDSEDDPDPYIATARYVVENGSIVETDFDEGAGVEVHRYNSNHYVVSETLFADSSTPVTFTYDLDPTTNVSRGASMSCTGQAGLVTRAVRVTSNDDEAKVQAIVSACVLRR